MQPQRPIHTSRYPEPLCWEGVSLEATRSRAVWVELWLLLAGANVLEIFENVNPDCLKRSSSNPKIMAPRQNNFVSGHAFLKKQALRK